MIALKSDWRSWDYGFFVENLTTFSVRDEFFESKWRDFCPKRWLSGWKSVKNVEKTGGNLLENQHLRNQCASTDSFYGVRRFRGCIRSENWYRTRLMHLVYKKTCNLLPEMGGGRTFVSRRGSVFHHGPCSGWWGDGIESGPVWLLNLLGFDSWFMR